MSGYAYAAKEPTASTTDLPDGWPDDWILNWVDSVIAALADQLQAAVENAQYLLDYFDSLDANGDGALTLSESGLTSAEFDMLDLDGDGYLTEAELQSITDGLTYAEALLMLPSLTQEQFDDIDLNGDGELSYAELVAAEADPSLEDWVDAWDNIVGDDPPWPPGWPVVDPDNPDDPDPDVGDDPPETPVSHKWTITLWPPVEVGNAQSVTIDFTTLDGAPSSSWHNHIVRLTGISHQLKVAGGEYKDMLTATAPNATYLTLGFFADIDMTDIGDDLVIKVEIPTIFSGFAPQDSQIITVDLDSVDVSFSLGHPEQDGAFTMTLTAKDSNGSTLTVFDGTGLSLNIEARLGSGAWSSFNYLVMLDGSAIDVTSGWTNGVWEGVVKYTNDDGKTEAQVSAMYDSDNKGSDSFYLGIAACLGPAILERQKAADIDPLSWIDLTATYTLVEYKAFVNGCSSVYIDGVYSGGANAPTGLGNAYANSATTVAELYALVCNMLTTTISANADIDKGWRRGEGEDASEVVAEGLAKDAWDSDSLHSEPSMNSFVIAETNEAYGKPNCILYLGCKKKQLLLPQNGQSRTVRSFAFCEEYSGSTGFDDQGQAGVLGHEDEYVKWDEETVVDATTTHTTAYWPDPDIRPDYIQWPWQEYGFQSLAFLHLIDWTFEHI